MRVQPLCLLVTALAACAGSRAQGVTDVAMRPLDAARLQRVVLDAAATRGLGLASPRSVRIASRRDLPSAACIGATRHCVAFLSAADRATLGAFLPQRGSAEAILSAPGTDADRGAQVLVLDQEDFRYQPDPARASAEEPTVEEVEDRARRQVLDWLTWLAAQGALPAR
jgi:hypothetical protein